MEITIYLLSKEQALDMKGFILPHIFSLPESDKFWYFMAANEKKQPLGLMVIAPCHPEAELLSIGVSPEFSGQGVGTELLSYGIEKVTEAKISGIRMTYGLPPLEWDILDRFVRNSGFFMDEEENYSYVGTLQQLSQNTYLKGTETFKQVCSLDSLTEMEKRKLEIILREKNLINSEILGECDPKISYVWKEDNIEAMFLLSPLTDGVLINLYTWMGSSSPQKLLTLMQKSMSQAVEIYPMETEVIFTCLGKAGEKLLHYFLPQAKVITEFRSYYHTAMEKEEDRIEFDEEEEEAAVKQTPDETRIAYWEDMRPQPAEDTDLVCCDCRYRMDGNLLSCEKYERKPGIVLYGGDCPFKDL